MGWRGLPPVPMWLSWFGEPYRALVAEHLLGVGDGGRGLFVGLSDEPLPPAQWATGRCHRNSPTGIGRRTREPPTGRRDRTTPQFGDEAQIIPPLRLST
jgi:hypothetical protein